MDEEGQYLYTFEQNHNLTSFLDGGQNSHCLLCVTQRWPVTCETPWRRAQQNYSALGAQDLALFAWGAWEAVMEGDNLCWFALGDLTAPGFGLSLSSQIYHDKVPIKKQVQEYG